MGGFAEILLASTSHYEYNMASSQELQYPSPIFFWLRLNDRNPVFFKEAGFLLVSQV
jgi:hypothetical protein